jgi:hypothetical protein
MTKARAISGLTTGTALNFVRSIHSSQMAPHVDCAPSFSNYLDLDLIFTVEGV